MTVAIISVEFLNGFSKDDRALINVLRQKSSQRLLRKFSGKNLVTTSVDRLLKKSNSTGVTESL